MGDGKVERAIQHGKARTNEIKTRVPELRERVPELRERVPELRERMPELTEDLRHRGTELRTKGAELRTRSSELARQYAKLDVSWARCGYAKAAREGLLSLGLGPLIDFYTRTRTVGREVFDDLEHPVVFVANHSSHLDTPTILRAMPRKWRARTAVAAAADYFYDSRWKASGVALLFNTVPLGRKGGGLGNGATDHVDRLIDEGWNLVMFPEGTRSRDGGVNKVRSGAAVIAAHHDVDDRADPRHAAPTTRCRRARTGPSGSSRPLLLPPPRRRGALRAADPPRRRESRRDVMEQVRAFWDGEERSSRTCAPAIASPSRSRGPPPSPRRSSPCSPRCRTPRRRRASTTEPAVARDRSPSARSEPGLGRGRPFADDRRFL